MGQTMSGGTEANLNLADGVEMRRRIAAFDWSSTAIGPMDQWPQSLRSSVDILLSSPHPMLLWWGPGLVQLYNDAYVSAFGQPHHWGLGQPAAIYWREAKPPISTMADAMMAGGISTFSEVVDIAMTRRGFAEEVHMALSCTPIFDEGGAVGGVSCACTEETARVLGERRMAVLRALANGAASARTVDQACARIRNVLAANSRDLPFTLLYLFDEDQETARLKMQTGFVGLAEAAPAVVRLGQGEDIWRLSDLLARGRMTVTGDLTARLATPLPGPWPEQPDSAVMIPLARAGRSGFAGCLIAGISARLMLNEEYETFLDLAGQQVATAIGNAGLYDREAQYAAPSGAAGDAGDAFFSNVSRALRTPLTLMLGPLEEALADRMTSPAGRERLGVAHRNGLRLLRLVNRLMDFDRVEAGQVRASFEPTDLAAYTADLVSSFRVACDAAGLTLTVDCPALDEPVYVDREMWEKIVLNLVSNAFKYTFAGEIRVSVRGESGGTLLEVSDMGTGIPEPELARIFDRFHRVDAVRARTYEGPGIGLALVRELVGLNGGTVEVSSALGQGSCFTVRLPFGSAHLPGDRIAPERSRAPAVAGAEAYVEEAMRWLVDVSPASNDETPFDDAHPLVHASHGCRVLVVDDNAEMRDYLRQLLSNHYRVLMAEDGQQALETIALAPPDLVLADIMMPRIDGFGLLRAVRADPRTAEIPVILLSAKAGKEAKAEGLDAGADDYLTKPFNARELLARTAAHLEMARVRRQASADVQRSETKLEAALVTANMAHWRWDPSTDDVVASSTMGQLFGLLPGEIWQARTHGLALVHPADRDWHRDLAVSAGGAGRAWDSQYRIIRPCDGRIAWLEERANPVIDEATGRTVISGLVWDITSRKQAEAVIQGQREAMEVALKGGSLAASLGVLVDAAREQYGDGVRAAFYLANEDRTRLRHIVGMPDGNAEDMDGFALTGAWLGIDPILTTDVMTDPQWLPWREIAQRACYRGCWIFPIHCRQGLFVGSFVVYWSQPREATPQDIDLAALFTQCASIIIARDTEAALRRQAEGRLRTLMEGIPQLVWRAADGGRWTWSSPQWSSFTGLPGAQSRDMGWLDALHPDDRDRATAAWRDAARTGQLELEARIRQQPGGNYRWFQTRATPVRDTEGQIVEWIGSSSDVHELRALQMRQQVLVAELQHRVRNMLTVVRSVFTRTVETGEDLANAADHFRGRLDALARTQVIVARSAERHADLQDLVRDELLSVGASQSPAVQISGPDIMLPAPAAESVGLAIHELTTNALKYGALKIPGAKLDIQWVVDMDDKDIPILNFTWLERGVPAVPVRPAREGFGRELIEEALPYRLGGTTSLEFLGGGICCRITVPLPVLDGGGFVNMIEEDTL